MSKFQSDAMRDLILAQARKDQRAMIEQVVDWRQEDYDDGVQYLFVTCKNGETRWEKWCWHSDQTKYCSAPEMIDKLAEAGMDRINQYRFIHAMAKCVKRANTWQELRA